MADVSFHHEPKDLLTRSQFRALVSSSEERTEGERIGLLYVRVTCSVLISRLSSPKGHPSDIRENLNDYCCHVMQKVRRYTEYSMTWHLLRANMKFDENLVIFMQL